jgi:hypothetical protein
MKAYQKIFRELSSGLSLCDKELRAAALLPAARQRHAHPD